MIYIFDINRTRHFFEGWCLFKAHLQDILSAVIWLDFALNINFHLIWTFSISDRASIVVDGIVASADLPDSEHRAEATKFKAFSQSTSLELSILTDWVSPGFTLRDSVLKQNVLLQIWDELGGWIGRGLFAGPVLLIHEIIMIKPGRCWCYLCWIHVFICERWIGTKIAKVSNKAYSCIISVQWEAIRYVDRVKTTSEIISCRHFENGCILHIYFTLELR